MALAAHLVEELERTREWTLKLIADLAGNDWQYQPAAGVAHPLWLCGHLASSQGTLVFDRCLGRSGAVEAAFKAHFPIGAPVKSANEHDYPPVEVVLKVMEETHTKTLEAVGAMTDALLAEPAFAADGKTAHPHYRDKAGAVVHCSRHEAFHAGQIATIRRLLGKPFLR